MKKQKVGRVREERTRGDESWQDHTKEGGKRKKMQAQGKVEKYPGWNLRRSLGSQFRKYNLTGQKFVAKKCFEKVSFWNLGTAKVILKRATNCSYLISHPHNLPWVIFLYGIYKQSHATLVQFFPNFACSASRVSVADAFPFFASRNSNFLPLRLTVLFMSRRIIAKLEYHRSGARRRIHIQNREIVSPDQKFYLFKIMILSILKSRRDQGEFWSGCGFLIDQASALQKNFPAEIPRAGWHAVPQNKIFTGFYGLHRDQGRDARVGPCHRPTKASTKSGS